MASMERVPLGNSDLEVTRLCLGTWNMSGQAGWGPDIEEAISVVRHVLDTGCNFIDTARLRRRPVREHRRPGREGPPRAGGHRDEDDADGAR